MSDCEHDLVPAPQYDEAWDTSIKTGICRNCGAWMVIPRKENEKIMSRFENMDNDHLAKFRRELKDQLIVHEDHIKYIISELLVVEDEFYKRL